MLNKRLYLLIITLGCFIHARAQQTVSTTGETITNSTGSISYTIGQVDYISIETAFSLSQGVQQVYTKSPVTYISTLENSITVSVWPNPIVNSLFVKINNNAASGFSYQIFSIEGQLIEIKKIISNNTTIDTHSYNTGVYIISIIHANNPSIRFKIIKK